MSFVVLLCIAGFGYLGPHLWPYSYTSITALSSAPPSLEHPFGTTTEGRDLFALTMRGVQVSLQISFVVAVEAGLIGTIWGAVSGFYSGWIDNALMRLVDLVMAFPLIAVASVLAFQFTGAWWLTAVVLGLLMWTGLARLVRGVVLSLRERQFIEASRAMGARDVRILFKHLIPNAMGPIIVNVTILIATSILVATSLSFLGFGIQPPDVSLGLLVSEAQGAVSTRPWLFYIPGVFIILIALSANFIGDGLRDALDPRQMRVRK